MSRCDNSIVRARLVVNELDFICRETGGLPFAARDSGNIVKCSRKGLDGARRNGPLRLAPCALNKTTCFFHFFFSLFFSLFLSISLPISLSLSLSLSLLLLLLLSSLSVFAIHSTGQPYRRKSIRFVIFDYEWSHETGRDSFESVAFKPFSPFPLRPYAPSLSLSHTADPTTRIFRSRPYLSFSPAIVSVSTIIPVP